MKITVTGHKGYVGKRVFFRLRALGLNPVGVDIGDKLIKSDVIVHLAARLDNSVEMVDNNLLLYDLYCAQ